jgi:Putative prokaryotic signal transducing protein
MPLVHPANVEEPTMSERRQTARKIKPEFAEGKLVKVARGESQPEAEFIAGMLLEEGIPSMLRRSGGFDVPDFMAAGPRDVLVPESAAQAAREALAWDDEPL